MTYAPEGLRICCIALLCLFLLNGQSAAIPQIQNPQSKIPNYEQ